MNADKCNAIRRVAAFKYVWGSYSKSKSMFPSSKGPRDTEIYSLSFLFLLWVLHKSIEISILGREKIPLPLPVLNLAKCIIQYCLSRYSPIQLAAMGFKRVEEWAVNFSFLDSNGFLWMIINWAIHCRGFFFLLLNLWREDNSILL